MSLTDTIGNSLSLAKELQRRSQQLLSKEVLEELDKYIQFFETLPTVLLDSQTPCRALYSHMRFCKFRKLYDEPHIYESMNVKIPLEGILQKHLRDSLTLLDLCESLSGRKQQIVYEKIVSLLELLAKSSPCLDAYVTQLDRLVRILQTPTIPSKKIQTIPLHLPLDDASNDYAVAQGIFRAFCETKVPLEETLFHQFVMDHSLLGNETYKTVFIPTFQELMNLLEEIYQTNQISEMVLEEK